MIRSPTLSKSILDAIGDAEAKRCARRLAEDAGIFSGFGAGTNLAAAYRLLARSGVPGYGVVAKVRAVSLAMKVSNGNQLHTTALDEGLQKTFLQHAVEGLRPAHENQSRAGLENLPSPLLRVLDHLAGDAGQLAHHSQRIWLGLHSWIGSHLVVRSPAYLTPRKSQVARPEILFDP